MIAKTVLHAQLPIFDRFIELAPNRPYCTNNTSQGIHIRSKGKALKYRYIQPNPPAMCHWLVFDVDHDNPMIWEDTGLPAPNFITRNPDNCRAHIIYAVESICTSEAAKPKPLAFMAAVQAAYTETLQADRGYGGLITKNPLNSHWHVQDLHSDVYSLGELADSVELSRQHWTRKRASNEEQYALGRNCALFHRLRYWAYDHVNDYRPGRFEVWRKKILEQCESYNQFPEPLPYGEVKSTAKSVAGWVWKNYRGNGSGRRRGAMAASFAGSQIPIDLVGKQRLAALRTADIKRAATEERIVAAIDQLIVGGEKVTKAAVARIVGMSRERISKDYSHHFIAKKA